MASPAGPRILRWPVLLGLGLLLGALLHGYGFFPNMVQYPLELYGRDAQGLDQREFLYRLYWQGKAPSPLAYRPLGYWLEALLMRLTGFNLGVVDVLLNTGWTAIAFAATVRFAARFVAPGSALFAGGWMLLACLIGFQEHLHQPSDFPNLALAASLYLASLQPASVPLLALGMLGTLNRESFLLIMGYPILLHLQDGTWRKVLAPLGGGLAACLITGGIVLALVGRRAAYEPLWMFPRNITPEAVMAWAPDVLLGFAIPLGIALRGWKHLPVPLQAGAVFALFYFGVMLLVGRIQEFRLLLPVLPLLCTAAVCALTAESPPEALTRHSVEA